MESRNGESRDLSHSWCNHHVQPGCDERAHILHRPSQVFLKVRCCIAIGCIGDSTDLDKQNPTKAAGPCSARSLPGNGKGPCALVQRPLSVGIHDVLIPTGYGAKVHLKRFAPWVRGPERRQDGLSTN
jgi:hypothetical protein